MGEAAEPLEVASLSRTRAKRFLRKLGECPFVAVVFDGDMVRVYTKDTDPEHLEIIQELLDELE